MKPFSVLFAKAIFPTPKTGVSGDYFEKATFQMTFWMRFFSKINPSNLKKV